MVVDEFLCRFGSALCWRGATKHIAHTRAARIREEFAISRKQNSCRMVKGFLGTFVGATALALGYEIFMKWLRRVPKLNPLSRTQQR